MMLIRRVGRGRQSCFKKGALIPGSRMPVVESIPYVLESPKHMKKFDRGSLRFFGYSEGIVSK